MKRKWPISVKTYISVNRNFIGNFQVSNLQCKLKPENRFAAIVFIARNKIDQIFQQENK